jgi:hypothetical protein
MEILTIYRNGNSFWNVKLDNSCNQSKTIMGDNVINLSFQLSNYVPFAIGDYCVVFGETYKINKQPGIRKLDVNSFAYTLVMEFEGYDLSKAIYMNLANDNSLTESVHSLTGTADLFIDLMLQNINRVSAGWTKGEIISTEIKTLSFNGENCYAVLGRLATEFNTEFAIIGKKIHLTKKFTDKGYTLSVGYNRGLYEISRVDSTRVITRLYPYGSDKNLPTTYTGKRLHLPPKSSLNDDCLVSNVTWFQSQDDGGHLYIHFKAPQDPGVTSIEMVFGDPGSGTFPYSKTLPLTGGVVGPQALGYSYDAKLISHGGTCEGAETPVFNIVSDNSQPLFPLVPNIYLEKNVDKYGLTEDRALFEDIYPHRTGSVTAIDAVNPFKIVDSAIDFNINSYTIPGLPVQVTFMTGQLAGYTFDVSSYDHGTRTIIILKNKNEQALDVPSNLIKAAAGDKYVVTNITMPDEYIEAAEAELLERAKKTLDTYSEPQYTIQAVLDTRYMEAYQREVFVGDTIWIKDTQMEIDRKIRIVTCVRNLVEPYSFQITLSDVIEVGTKDKIFSSIATSQRSVNDLGNQVVTRDVYNGNMVLPPSSSAVGAVFENVLVDKNTNKLYRQE